MANRILGIGYGMRNEVPSAESVRRADKANRIWGTGNRIWDMANRIWGIGDRVIPSGYWPVAIGFFTPRWPGAISQWLFSGKTNNTEGDKVAT